MSKIYLNRITIKSGGVYLSLRDESLKNYKSTYINSLTKIYKDGGVKALDLELLDMLVKEEVLLRGTHPSVLRFILTFNLSNVRNLEKKYQQDLIAIHSAFVSSGGKESKTKYNIKISELRYQYLNNIYNYLPQYRSKLPCFIFSENNKSVIGDLYEHLMCEGVAVEWSAKDTLSVHPYDFKYLSELVDDYGLSVDVQGV